MELAGRSLKGQLGYANKLGARYVATVAGEKSTLQDMRDGSRHELATGSIAASVRQGIGETT
jgi:hypothetical protein